jgi:hypothetical protein
MKLVKVNYPFQNDKHHDLVILSLIVFAKNLLKLGSVVRSTIQNSIIKHGKTLAKLPRIGIEYAYYSIAELDRA